MPDARTETARRPRWCALIAAILLVAGVGTLGAGPERTSHSGTIEGLVRLTVVASASIPSGAYPSRRVTKPAPKAGEMANVIVFVKDPPQQVDLQTTRARMLQQDEAFVPRVLAVTRGSSVEFPNTDPYFHNVFSLSSSASFDLGRYPSGDSRARAFSKSGLVKVYCHLHSHMSGTIMVFDHPYFRKPEMDGTFAIGDLPAGTYRISAWHERIGESVRTVSVEAGRAARVEFDLPVEDR